MVGVQEYRGWKIEPYVGTQLGYHVGEGAKSKPGKGRKVKGYLLTYAPDKCTKIVDTLKEAHAYINGYMGVDKALGPPEEPSEPEEEDITTGDHRVWWQHGQVYFNGDVQGLKAQMDADGYWPNVWFVSDHGNAHLVDLTEGEADALA
jgi:hypothetical protein